MPDLDLLVAFLEIYRSGSLTAAASRLGVTQPAVSGQLARLERQLGEPLFVRSRQGARPTARADELARRVGSHLDHLRTALTPDDRATYRGTVRIGGASDGMAMRVLPALAPLAARGLQLRISLGLAQDLLVSLANRQLDLVVSAVRPTGRNLVATPFVDEEFVLVGPPALARTIDPDLLASDPVRALAHLPLVAYAEELPIIRRYWRSEFGKRPPNEIAVVIPDLRGALAAVVAGAGVSVLPRYVAASAIGSGSVEVLHQPDVAPLNTLYLAVPAGEPAHPAVGLVHRHLMSRAADWSSL